MTEPSPSPRPLGTAVWHTGPAWQQRLLDRIQNLAADRAQLLSRGYESSPGGTDGPLQAWRTHLHGLAAVRREAETHAEAVGIRRDHIIAAHAYGSGGIRPAPQRAGDAVRDTMVDGVAADVWQLQHMAALETVRLELSAGDAGFDPEQDATAQYARNMDALWRRAREVADAVGLTDDERNGMWATDTGEWRRLLDVTVSQYDLEDVEERWRVYAWPGIETDAQRAVSVLGSRIARGSVIDPVPIPAPQVMLSESAAALFRDDPSTETDGPDTAADAALPDGTEHDWTTTEPAPTPADDDPAAGVEP
ncbi:hypothetical protein [Nocardia mexicana]|uniref:Uncharacterized protein n=1 Tax=Nocardia mexicana TaxID=279262 RepID=A0A370GMD1_9NOCA|nr:hypothetical protein [Nocardia mexicana]RDI43574.1 hypothetical protein DFR68_12041 [Nocardia mexicana]